MCVLTCMQDTAEADIPSTGTVQSTRPQTPQIRRPSGLGVCKPLGQDTCTHSIGRVGSMTGTTASVVAYTQSYALAVCFGASTYCSQSGLGRHSTATRTLPATILRARDRPREQTGRLLTGGGLSAKNAYLTGVPMRPLLVTPRHRTPLVES